MSLAEGNWVRYAGMRGPDLSDQTCEALVRAELRQSPYGAIRTVACQMNGGVLTLSGSVPSYYLKQVAQRLALNVLRDAGEIVNQLRVEP
jgi:BON domain